LNEKEMKNVVGGAQAIAVASDCDVADVADGDKRPCDGKKEYDSCTYKGTTGICRYAPISGLVCFINPVCGR
jgi:hypothetical protein